MFRQRLKGGHRVGANSKVSSTPQNVDLNSPSLPQVSSQDWYPQTPYGNIEVSGNVKTSDISKSSGYHHSTQNAQPQSTKHYQYGSQMQNGSNPQNQGQDAWNWGSEDNWNDWGNSDSYYINANNNNNQPTTSYEDQSFISEDQSGAFSAQSTAQISNTVETNNNVPLHYSEATSSCKVENISDHSQTLDKDYGSVHIHNTLRNNSSHDLNEIAASYDTETTEAIFNHPKEDNSQYSQTVPDFNENSQFSRIQTFFKSDEKDIDISVPDIHSSLNIETTSEAVYNTSTSSVNNFSYGQANPQHNNSCLLKDNEQKLENENKSDNWEDAEFNETSANDKETTLANDNENRSYLDMMQGLALNNERLENLEANSIAESSKNVQTVSQFPQNHNSQGLENLELINIAESFEDVQANIQLPQDQDSHENNTGTSNEASLPQVPSWDDEWGDGWETKPLSCQGSESSLEQSENNTETSNSFPVVESLNQSDMKGSDSNDTFEFTVKDSVKDEYEKDWEVSTNPTNQFPEVSNIQVLDQELHGIFSGPTEATLVVSGDVHDDHLLPTFSFKEKLDVIKVDDLSIKGIPNKDKESASVDSTKMDNLSTKNTEIIDEGTSNVIIQKPVAFPSEAPSQKLSTRSCPASVLQDNFESEDKERMPSDQDSFPEKLEDKFCVPNIAQSVPGPSGNIPNLQARKGSPFQPPAYKRTTVVHQSRNAETKILSSHPSILQSNSNPITPLQENTILLNSQPPESNVKLQVVHNSFQNRNLGEADLNRPLVVSERDETTNSAYFDQILPAHFSSMQSKLEQPKVRTLETMNDTPTSPSVLDLSQLSIKKERDNDSPAFKRMVPGESTKGESAPTLGYQIPVIVPAMPSGRVVTGNDNPQPIPSVRVKQEHGEIRAPPDGPDTGVLQDESPGVIPPIRSETIGSEGHAVRLSMSNRRDDDDSDSQRERGKDGKRDYYLDRHSERKRNEGSFYSHDSPQRSNKQRDIDYDPFYGERHYNRRPLRDDDYDDEEEDGDERKYLQNMRERRRRAYRDELERYGGRERQYGREKRRNRDRDGRYLLEDEDFYEAPSSDRSRPSSRSSSFGNADSETGAGSHLSHLDDYYDPRYAKPRDKPREKGYRDPYREYPPYKKREDKEKDPYDGKGFYPYADRYGQREMYDPHSYYFYYQQSYQKYLEQHPYYREYYRQYYGRYGYPGGDPSVDDKTSTRSGRSSVNDEIKKASLSSQFHQDFVDQSSVSAYEPSLYPDHYSFTCKSYVSGDGSRVPSVTDETPVEPKPRTSPQLYTGPHLKASFTSGGKLLLVLPNDPKEGEKATVQLRNVQKMLAVDNEYGARIKKLASYPGPLTINDTHKDVVLRFCEEKSSQALKNETLFDRESVVLMWDYLSLLVKQNGKVSGADIASLLIRGRGRLTDLGSMGSLNEKRTNVVEGVSSDNGDANNQIRSDRSELLKNFSELLCLGRKKEAVEYAIKEELWGYAMVLAAKMDSMTHARVIAAFMQSIPSNDVLHTLIQHLSGKKPEVTRNYCSEKWGDWRLHLAMMVSNPTGNLQKDMSSIIALGDSLVAKQRYHAAHICYLAADAEWGCYSNKDSKLVLIGSSPHQPFQLFASDDAIQCTEIFEFAKCLDSNSPILLAFQSYKLIYGYRLAEFGYPNEALKYCQVITEAVIKQPTAFHLDFVAKVFELASQLKYHDVYYQMGEGELSEMEDPDWLQSLNLIFQTLQYQANEKYLKSLESDPGVVKSDVNTDPEGENRFSARRNSEVNRVHSQASNYSNHLPSDPTEQEPYVENTQTPDIQEIETPRASVGTVQKGKNFSNEEYSYQRMHSSTSVGSTPLNSLSYGETAANSTQNDYYQQQQQYLQYQQKSQETPSIPLQHHQMTFQQNQQAIPQQQESVDHSGPVSVLQYPVSQSEQTFSHENPQTVPEQNGRESSLQHVPLENTVTSSEMSAEELQYWKLMTGKGDDSSKKTEDLVDSTLKQDDKNQVEETQEQQQQQQHQLQKQLAEGYDEKDDDKKSSFLGSLFGGWRKNTNQAKLPDDKNPSIVWDEDKKKWVNKDGDTTDEAAPPPPPSTIMNQPPPILRGGPKKSRYVDPVGERGRTKITSTALPAPIPSMGAIPPPKGIIRSNEQPIPTSWEPQQYPDTPDVPNASPSIQTRGSPDMIQRQRFASSSSSVDLYDDSDLNQGAEQGNSIPMMNPVESQPQPLFFNPAQFQAQQPAQPNPPRRAGPAKRSYNPQR